MRNIRPVIMIHLRFFCNLLGTDLTLAELCRFLFSICKHLSTSTEVAFTITSRELWDPGWLSMTWLARFSFYMLEANVVRLVFLVVSYWLTFRGQETEENTFLKLLFPADLFEVGHSPFGPCKSIDSEHIRGNFTPVSVSTEQELSDCSALDRL